MPAVTVPLRADLAGFGGYSSAAKETTPTTVPITTWLNANEAAEANSADPSGSCRRYPQPQPAALREALAELYQVAPQQLLCGRGSDEAIDLLIRALCRPGGDAIAITPPVFGMYAVCARIHGSGLVEVPLVDAGDSLRVDVPALAAAVRATADSADPVRVVFVASPGNPSGAVVAPSEISQLAAEVDGQAVVVVDEAYGEFSPQRSAVDLLDRHGNLAILRTLSKAHGLAGARVGSVIAHPDLIAALAAIQAPYPLPAPVVDLAVEALRPQAVAATARAVEDTLVQRDRLAAALAAWPGCERVYGGEANFVLARFTDPTAVLQALREHGIIVRDQSHNPQLERCLRITAGTPAQTDAVIACLQALDV